MLNEEALSASTAHIALRASTPDDPADAAPRYSDAAGIEHHPQVTDFLPRRFRSIGVLALIGVATTAAVEGLHWFVVPLASIYGGASTAAFDLSMPGGIAAWCSSSVLLLSAATCVLIYSLRRHRVDDFRGRYRVWMAAATACLLMSFVSVAPVERLLTAAAAHYIQWTALRDGAALWLLVGGLPCLWIAARLWLDARESRLAAVSLAGAYLLYGVAIGSYLSTSTLDSSNQQAMITTGASLSANWLLLIAVVSYGRFVVLDVQGLIPIRERKPALSKLKAIEKDQAVNQSSSRGASASHGPLRAFREDLAESKLERASSTQWIDGSVPESDDYDDEADDRRARKLSKADRKRLRQQKRAA